LSLLEQSLSILPVTCITDLTAAYGGSCQVR
jgi:hypothetical protein